MVLNLDAPIAQPTIQPKISIAMGTYNGARYVVEQLDSLQSQTHPPDEIIICDDASQDSTVPLLIQYAETCSIPIQIYQNGRNLGYANNFAGAIELTTGDLIFLCDQDDIWHPLKIEKFVERFRLQPDVMLLVSDANLVDEQLHPFGKTLWQLLEFAPAEHAFIQDSANFDYILRRGCNLFSGSLMAFRKELKSFLLPLPTVFAHDIWLGLLTTAIARLDLIQEPLNDYRQHSQQTTDTKAVGLLFSLQRLQGSIKRLRSVRFYQDWLQEHLQLRERLSQIDRASLNPGVLESLDAKIAYLQSRFYMRQRSLLHRFPLVFREYSTGRYARFSRGWRSILIDLML